MTSKILAMAIEILELESQIPKEEWMNGPSDRIKNHLISCIEKCDALLLIRSEAKNDQEIEIVRTVEDLRDSSVNHLEFFATHDPSRKPN